MPLAQFCSALSLPCSLARRARTLLPVLLLAGVALFTAPSALRAQTAHFAGAGSVLGSGFSHPFGVAVDASGNVYVGDSSNNAVKKLPYSGGSYGTPVTIGSGFSQPAGVAVDANGNVFVADQSNNAVKMIPYNVGFYGTPVTLGSGFSRPSGVAVDASGNVYVADYGNTAVKKIPYSSGSYGTPVILGSGFANPYDVAVDASGNVYVADYNHNAVKMIPYSGGSYGTPVVLGSGFSGPIGVAVDASGSVYVADTSNNAVKKIPYSGGSYGTPIKLGSGFNSPTGVAVDANFNVFIGDYGNNAVKKSGLAANLGSAAVSTATPATQALTFLIDTAGTLPTLSNANVVTQGASGADFTLGTGSTCTGAVTAGSACTINIAFAPQAPGRRLGAVKLLNSSGTLLATAYLSGIGTGPLVTATPGTQSSYTVPTAPYGLVIDPNGTLYYTDFGYLVYKVAAGGASNTLYAGTAATPCPDPTGTCGDGGQATAATLTSPADIALDGLGDIYIADANDYKIRKVTVATGVISTVAGNGTICSASTAVCGDGGAATSANMDPQDLTFDTAGNMYIADVPDNRIRLVTAATGIISTVAGNGTACASTTATCGDGGLAINANLTEPRGVALDAAGNLYIVDSDDNRVRMVTPAGLISTVAGNGTACTPTTATCGDGAAATSANLNAPRRVLVDAAGNLYISDRMDNRIRKVTAATGIMSTVAGTGTACTAGATCGDGSGATATGAYLNNPVGMALDKNGNLYISDYGTGRIRIVSASATLAFPTTAVAATSATQTATVQNIGNAPLTVSIPSTGQNPSLSSYFTQSNSSTCPLVYSNSSAGTLASGATCTEIIAFAPTAAGAVSGLLTFTDNNLNATAATQSLHFAGATTSAITVTVDSVTAITGSSSVQLQFAYGAGGNPAPANAPTLKVNGSATGVGAYTCVSKTGHKTCTASYNASSLSNGTYTISVTVPADGNYSATTQTGTLTINSTGMGIITPPQTLAAPVTLTATPVSSRTVTAPMLWQSPVDTPSAPLTLTTDSATESATPCPATDAPAKTDKGTKPSDCQK